MPSQDPWCERHRWRSLPSSKRCSPALRPGPRLDDLADRGDGVINRRPLDCDRDEPAARRDASMIRRRAGETRPPDRPETMSDPRPRSTGSSSEALARATRGARPPARRDRDGRRGGRRSAGSPPPTAPLRPRSATCTSRGRSTSSSPTATARSASSWRRLAPVRRLDRAAERQAERRADHPAAGRSSTGACRSRSARWR